MKRTESPLSMYRRSRRLCDQGYLQGAIALMEEIVARVPEASLWVVLGSDKREAGDPEGAFAAFRAALDCDPSWARAHSNMGLLYQDAGAYDEAESQFRRSIELEEIGTTFVFLAALLAGTGREEEAIACYERSIELDGDNDEAYFNLAILVEAIDRARAIRLLEKATELGSERAGGELRRLLSTDA